MIYLHLHKYFAPRLSILLLLLLLSSFVFAASHHPEEFLQSISGAKDEGAQIVKHFCANCHGKKPLIPLGAPRYKEHKDWEARVAQGLDVLLVHTSDGYQAMPARGGCFECSDEQLIRAILVMLPDSLRKDLLKPIGEHKKTSKLKK